MAVFSGLSTYTALATQINVSLFSLVFLIEALRNQRLIDTYVFMDGESGENWQRCRFLSKIPDPIYLMNCFIRQIKSAAISDNRIHRNGR